MTLYAPDGISIVQMERFEGLTSAVDCKGDDAAMSLALFKSKQAYNYGLKTSQYINEDDDQQILLIANHEGCGPAEQKSRIRVISVTEDSADLTIAMRSKVIKWSDVAGLYDLDFGKAALQQPSQRLRTRSF
ncbi:MAG: hypothetical protein Q9226_003789 [Calogaya cf. arnoldii]